MYDLGLLLKDLREEKGISMDNMVNDIKRIYDISIAKSTISKWENNKAEPTMENARVLCNYFEVTLDYLMGLSKDKNSEYKVNYKEKFQHKLLEKFEQLNEIGKKEAIKRVGELTEIYKYCDSHLTPVAAHAKDNASIEDIQYDNDIMNDDEFWNK